MFSHGVTPPSSITLNRWPMSLLPNMPYWSLTARSEQAEQLFVALKTLGKDVMFVRFPDENHELSRSGKPRHRLERFRFILDWFSRHLAEAAGPP